MLKDKGSFFEEVKATPARRMRIYQDSGFFTMTWLDNLLLDRPGGSGSPDVWNTPD
jgi:hypothetical protein